MKTSTQRRTLLGALVVCASALAGGSVLAQAFPSKPIRWIVVAPAGSSLDVIARALQDRLRDTLGQPIVIENRAGAGGTLGTNEVAKSAPDGHTWVISFNGPLAFAPFLYDKLPYNPARDLQPVVLTTSQPNLIAVHVGFPANTMAELVQVLKANPGKYNFASVGNGSSSHLTMEYVKALTGTFAVHIPFNGGPPAVLATAGGDTQILATVPTVITPQITAGRMKAIAVTGAQRYNLAPNVPTVAESGIKELRNFEAIAWNGVLVAAGTPRPIVDRINAAINAAMNDPAVKERFRAAGLEAAGGSPEQFAKLMADEAVKWEPVIKRTGAKLD
ncbi:MAG: tripartite tricarboxylate transporter substrate binding protein [Rhodoferax sp.]|nr:tripartite tricarboxylate transporter substrate binding protein [Rhodoferax sp.]